MNDVKKDCDEAIAAVWRDYNTAKATARHSRDEALAEIERQEGR